MSIDWPDLEEHLFILAHEDIKRFAAMHQKEEFYGFALDCNSDYGNVLLCLNTPEDLRQRAVLYATNPPHQQVFDDITRRLEKEFGRKIFRKRRAKTPEEQEQKLRWSLGDWKYQGFNSEHFETKWEPFEEAVCDACMEEEPCDDSFMTPTQDRFMRMACRVLIRLESSNVFESLNRTSDFKTYVGDHDESIEDSWQRLEMVRKVHSQD